ncbi:MAG: nitrogen regulation protein NR(II) [Gammaproteobacteria bacterium]
MTIRAETALHLIEHLSTAVLLFDRNLQLRCINSAGEHLLSVSQRRVSGRTPLELLPSSPFFAEAIKRSLELGSVSIERGIDLNLHNEQSITVDCMITPIIDGEKYNEVVVELVDSNSFIRVMREENLQAVHDAGKISVRGMAHEVKNPLGGIRGAAQLLERELVEGELTEYTKIIISEADRLRNFIDRMLTPNVRPDITQFNIHEVLEYVLGVVEAECDTSLKLTRNYDPSIPSIHADREQMIQSMLNLVRNAVQAIDENGTICLKTRARRKVTIQHKLHKLVLQVEIIDDGPGIPPEIENGAFYPMVTGRSEGTGLGLSIAQSLIQSHGGLIEYERKDEKTCFRVLLPLGPANE